MFKDSFGLEFELYLRLNNNDLSLVSIQQNEASYNLVKLKNFMLDVLQQIEQQFATNSPSTKERQKTSRHEQFYQSVDELKSRIESSVFQLEEKYMYFFEIIELTKMIGIEITVQQLDGK